MELTTVIITIDTNTERVTKLNQNLLDNGLQQGIPFYGEKTKIPSERNNLIFKAHRDCCLQFIHDIRDNKSSKYLLILEDDALVCIDNIGKRIERVLEDVNKINPEWVILNLGCLATSITKKYPRNQFLNYTTDLYNGKGLCAHSYLVNGNTIQEWITKIPEWKRPYAVELWESVDSEKVFMVQPLFFSQFVHFAKWIPWVLPGINNPHYWYIYANWLNSLQQKKVLIGVVILIIAICSYCRARRIRFFFRS